MIYTRVYINCDECWHTIGEGETEAEARADAEQSGLVRHYSGDEICGDCARLRDKIDRDVDAFAGLVRAAIRGGWPETS